MIDFLKFDDRLLYCSQQPIMVVLICLSSFKTKNLFTRSTSIRKNKRNNITRSKMSRTITNFIFIAGGSPLMVTLASPPFPLVKLLIFVTLFYPYSILYLTIICINSQSIQYDLKICLKSSVPNMFKEKTNFTFSIKSIK